MSGAAGTAQIVHASSVAFGRRGVLILGASGRGKSTLALQLMGMGCALVSDDRTALAARDGVVVAASPKRIRGRIEARGVGILKADPLPVARIVLLVDLDETEERRLPPERMRDLLGVALPVVHRVESPHFPAAILQYLKAGRAE